MEFKALGPLQALEDGREVVLDGRIRRRLLSALLVHAGREVSHTALERAAWGDEPPDTARRIVQSHLSRMRSLGMTVQRAGTGYLLDVSADAVDAHRFRAMSTGSRLRDASAEQLREALGWWRGEPWADLAESFAVADNRQLVDCRAAMRERLALLELTSGSHRSAAAVAEASVEDCPRREIAWVLWAVALYCEQRRGDALQVLHDGRMAVGGAGLDPGSVARAVEDAMIVERPRRDVVDWLVRALDDTRAPVVVGDGCGRPPGLPLPAGLAAAAALPFSGRRAEMTVLEGRWAAVAAGEFRAVLLCGEPGVGKSRTARELAVSVHRRGGAVLHGTCDAELDAPFQPVLEALRSAAGPAGETEVRRTLAPFAADLRRVWPDLLDQAPAGPPVETDPETDRFRAISSLVGATRALAAGTGVLVVLDDLQWCDAGTGQVLRRMVREQPPGVMVVGTYRDTETRGRAAWSETLAELLRHPSVERCPVVGLDTETVIELLLAACGPVGSSPAAPIGLADDLVELTGGNALFIGELLQHLLTAGGIVRAGDGWHLSRSLRDFAVPAGVREVAGRRVDVAHPRGAEVLEAAAVIGHRFTRAQLRSLVGPEAHLDDVLEAMLASRLISELGAGRFQFAHALVRGALLERMSDTRRARLHLTLADAAGDGDPAVSAPHWLAAAELQPDLLHRAIDCYVDAADRAMALGSPDSAIEHYRRALDVSEQASRSVGWTVQTETKLGTAERQVGETGHRRRLVAVGRQALDAGMTGAAAQAVLATYSGIPSRYLQANDAMLSLLDDILDRAVDLDEEVRAAVHALRATELMFAVDGERRSKAAAAAVRSVDGVDDPSVEARALSSALMLYFTEEPLDRHDIAQRLDRLCPELAARDRVVARTSMIQMYTARGDMARVPEWLADARSVCDEVGEPELRCYLAMVEVQQALLTQGVCAARARLEDMAALAGQGESWMARMPEPFGWTVDIYAGDGFGALADAYDAGIRARPDLPLLRATAAYTQVRCDRPQRARQHLDVLAGMGFDCDDRTWGYVATLVLSGLTAAELGSDHRVALRNLLVDCRTVVPLQPMPHDTPAHAIGVIDASVGAYDSAVEQFERALDGYSRIGAPLFAARTEAELARVLDARGAPGDGERACWLAHRARSGALRCGLGDLPDLSSIR